MHEIILQTNQLTKSYGKFTALDHADITVYRGDIYGLIGRNGAGKTTLISSVRSWLAIFFYPLFQFTNTLHRFLIHTVLHFTYRCYSVNCQ